MNHQITIRQPEEYRVRNELSNEKYNTPDNISHSERDLTKLGEYLNQKSVNKATVAVRPV
jgi:hypothetical protein